MGKTPSTKKNPKTQKRYPPLVTGAHGNARRMPNGKLAVMPEAHLREAEERAKAQARTDYYAALPDSIALHPDHASELMNLHILLQEIMLEQQKQQFTRYVFERQLRAQVLDHYGVDLSEEANPFKLDLPNGRLTRRDPAAPAEDVAPSQDSDHDAGAGEREEGSPDEDTTGGRDDDGGDGDDGDTTDDDAAIGATTPS